MISQLIRTLMRSIIHDTPADLQERDYAKDTMARIAEINNLNTLTIQITNL